MVGTQGYRAGGGNTRGSSGNTGVDVRDKEWVLWIQSRFWGHRESAGDKVGPGGHRSGCSFSRIP